MRMPRLALLFLLLLCLAYAAKRSATASPPRSGLRSPLLHLHTVRTSPQDLAVSGNFLAAGETRFISVADLLKLPQVHASVTDDTNFQAPEFRRPGAKAAVTISGVPLDTLAAALGLSPEQEVISALCSDYYEAHYLPSYLQAHKPLLVLDIDGRTADHWPRPGGQSYGPFLISHAHFVSRRPGSTPEEPQIPYGVVQISFADQAAFQQALAPRGNFGPNTPQVRGAPLAEQNCLRCHDHGLFGGHKAYRSWSELGRLAASHPDYFTSYVHNPRSHNPYSQMPPSPEYDQQTLADLAAYFKTFYTP